MGKDSEVQTLLTLLLIAEGGEVPMADLQRSLGIGASAMSRNIGMLSSTGYRNGGQQQMIDGLALVESWENPLDRRQKLVRLTPKGRGVVTRALKHVSKGG
jgi:DNA-binding MarR family transcriptional regulator